MNHQYYIKTAEHVKDSKSRHDWFHEIHNGNVMNLSYTDKDGERQRGRLLVLVVSRSYDAKTLHKDNPKIMGALVHEDGTFLLPLETVHGLVKRDDGLTSCITGFFRRATFTMEQAQEFIMSLTPYTDYPGKSVGTVTPYFKDTSSECNVFICVNVVK
jgi:hypothetical protein